MAYNNQDQDKRPTAPFDLFQFTLWAPSTAQGKYAQFKVDVSLDGKVSFIVRTGDPADKEKAKDGDVIKMRMGMWDFEKVVDLFRQCVHSKGEFKKAVVEQVFFRFNKDTRQREKLDTPRDGNKLWFVKDANGMVVVSLTQYNRTNIEFGFVQRRPEFVFKHEDGQAFSDAEMSQSGARAYLKILQELHQRVTASLTRQHQVPDLFKPPFVPNQGGNNNGGGQGNNNGYQNRNNNQSNSNSGGGNNNQRAAVTVEEDLDDDIPY